MEFVRVLMVVRTKPKISYLFLNHNKIVTLLPQIILYLRSKLVCINITELNLSGLCYDMRMTLNVK